MSVEIMKKFFTILVGIVCLLSASTVKAQSFAVRTNIAEWALMAPNVGVDLVLSDRSTLNISVGGTAGENYIKDAFIQYGMIEYRYWFSHQPYENFFLGLQFRPLHYRLHVDHSGKKGLTHNGAAFPVGFNFGYCWPLNSKFNLELCYGAGWYFYNNECSLNGSSHNIDFSTTNIGLSIAYILK